MCISTTRDTRKELPSLIVCSENANNMVQVKYSYVSVCSVKPFGWVYKIQGDTLYSTTKKECEWRIRLLYNSRKIDKETRDYLLKNLKKLKRGE